MNLDLTHAPPVLFLFGLSGSGKSYVGNLVHERAGWPVYHADDDITDELIAARDEGRSFTDEMRDRYFAIVAKRINAIRSTAPRLIVTQATYRRRHRDYIVQQVPGVELLYIKAPDALIAERIGAGRNGVTPSYAAVMRANFEPPDSGTKYVNNDSDDENIIRQLNGYYQGRPVQGG